MICMVRETDGTEQETVDEDVVTVSTIHRAKGLEWRHVIIANATERAFGGGGKSSVATAAARSTGSNGASGWRPKALGDDLPLPRGCVLGDAPRQAPATDTATPQGGGEGAAVLAQQDAEERRVAYVALTRAKESVVFTSAELGPSGREELESPFVRQALGEGAESDFTDCYADLPPV